MSDTHQNKIINFYKAHKRLPSYREIARLLGFSSTNAAFKVVQKMLEAGLLYKDKFGKLSPARIFGEISMLGSVKAGFPASTEEVLLDSVSLDDFLIDRKESTFMLKVDGDSMIEAGILDGDMVLVERTDKIRPGDIVIAEVDGGWTMKYLRNTGGKMWLEPANKHLRPIYPENEMRVAAKVKAVIRKF